MKRFFLFLILLIFLFSGCYHYHELNELAIVSGISVSFVNDKYAVTLEVVNSNKEQDDSSHPDFVVYQKKGKSLEEALELITQEIPYRLYFAHLNILIVDDVIAKRNLDTVVDFFARDDSIRGNFYVLIGNHSDTNSVFNPFEKGSSLSIVKSLEVNYKELGYTNLISFQDLLRDYLNPYKEMAIPSIHVSAFEKDKYVISGMGIFRNHKLVGFVDDNDSLVYNIIMGNAHKFFVKVEYSNQSYVVYEVLCNDSSVFVNDDGLHVSISISGKGSLVERTKSYHEDSNTVKELQNDLNRRLENMIKDSIHDIVSKYHTDIYGFKNNFFLENPDFIKKVNKNWNYEVLNQLNIDVSSQVKIIKTGNLNEVGLL